MKFFTSIIILLSMPYLSHANRSGPIAEPYAGYYDGKFEGTDLVEADVGSFVAGARLGYRTEGGYILGIDYAQGRGDFETVSSKYRFHTKDGGFFIGYEFPAYLKLWASYIFRYEATIDDYLGVGQNMEIEGDGFNVGLGVRGIPFVTFNITYQERNLTKFNGQRPVIKDNKIRTTMVTLSLPYNFPWAL